MIRTAKRSYIWSSVLSWLTIFLYMLKKCLTLPSISQGIPALSICCLTSATISLTNFSLASLPSFNWRSRSWYTSGWRNLSERSSSSTLILEIPSLCAIGEYISIVSLDFSICFSGVWYCIVRWLWSLSASLINITLISLAIARNILRRFSACLSILSCS